ncbi:MAG: hypothetical protein U1E27_08205, partial [Kiritimatiellia bacterium]|nr:hypothetical protein [Kiritimatiellia bacterium]
AGYMILAVHAAKWLAAEISGRILKYSPQERNMIFGITVNQAAATLAAVLVGTRIGLFDDSIMNGTILMILVSCLVGSWATDRYGRRVALETASQAPPASREDRILIPLGNRMNAGALMDFALLLRDRRAHEPLYPLNVALDGPDAEAHVAQGESVLENAVMRTVAAGVPIEPLTRIDTNRAGGILRAIREKHISCAILGWRRRETGLGLFFEDLLDQVLNRTSISLFVTRLPQPLNTMQRVVLLLPPLIHRQPGFAESFRRCFRLSSQMGARLAVIGGGEELKALKPFAGISVKSAWSEDRLTEWKQWPVRLKSTAQSSDLIVLISARRGQIPWQPALERCLRRLNDDYPEHNLLAVYPSETETPSENAHADEGLELECAIRIDRETPVEAAAGDLLARMLRNPQTAARTLRELRKSEPLTLTGEIGLWHTHSPDVVGTRVGLCVAQDAVRITHEKKT